MSGDRPERPDRDGSLASDVRAEFARAMLPEGRDFAGPVRGGIALETVERDGTAYGVALNDRGDRLTSSVVVDLADSR